MQDLWTFDLECVIGQDLINGQRSLPENANRAPVAPLVHTDEAKSLECHGLCIIFKVRIHELIRGDPLGERACILPHVLVMLCHLARFLVPLHLSCGVHVAPVKERTAGTIMSQLLAW